MENELWLSRDDTVSATYNICTTEDIEAGINQVGIYTDFITCFEAEIFHELFPVRLRKGRKKRIKRIVIELED